MIKIVQKASVKLQVLLMMKEHVFVIKIVNRVQVVILTFKMLSHVMETAGVNKLLNGNGNVNVVKVTTTKIPVWSIHLGCPQFEGVKFH